MENLLDKVYVLSDSLSDTGNLLNLTSGFIPNTPVFTPGRFSDGDIWLDYFAEEYSLTIAPFFGSSSEDIANSV